jgi:hypothetical protein
VVDQRVDAVRVEGGLTYVQLVQNHPCRGQNSTYNEEGRRTTAEGTTSVSLPKDHKSDVAS